MVLVVALLILLMPGTDPQAADYWPQLRKAREVSGARLTERLRDLRHRKREEQTLRRQQTKEALQKNAIVDPRKPDRRCCAKER